MRVGAEIAHAGVDMQLAIRRDAPEAIEAVAAGRMIALADADAYQLVAVLLARALLPLVPVEHSGTLVQCLLDTGTGHRTLVGTDLSIIVRRVHLADLHPVNLQFTRRLIDHRLDGGNQLVFARPALWPAQGSVGQDGDRAKPHRCRLIDERRCVAGGTEAAPADVGAVLLHDIKIGSQQPAVVAEAEFDMPLEGGACGTE